MQLYGIPLHIWDGNVFKTMANGVGEFIDFDEDTMRKYRLEVVRLKLSTYIIETINMVLNILTMIVTFKIRIVENRTRMKNI